MRVQADTVTVNRDDSPRTSRDPCGHTNKRQNQRTGDRLGKGTGAETICLACFSARYLPNTAHKSQVTI